MKRVARKANVKPGVHILRDTFCSLLAIKGIPAMAIKGLAGQRRPFDNATLHALESGCGRGRDSSAGDPWFNGGRGNSGATATGEIAK